MTLIFENLSKNRGSQIADFKSCFIVISRIENYLNTDKEIIKEDLWVKATFKNINKEVNLHLHKKIYKNIAIDGRIYPDPK